MGMGYAGNFAVVIESEDVSRVVGNKLMEQYDLAVGSMKEAGYDPAIFAQDIFHDMPGDSLDAGDKQQEAAYEKAYALYQKIQREFKRKTGIGILLGFHDQGEEGDRYDDLDGVFWHMDFSDCFPASKQFKTLRKKCKKWVGIRHFVTFG